MLVGAFGARAFGLRGGIPMEAAQTSSHHAPASCADITRSVQIPIIRSLTIVKKRGAAQGIDASFKALRVHSMYAG